MRQLTAFRHAQPRLQTLAAIAAVAAAAAFAQPAPAQGLSGAPTAPHAMQHAMQHGGLHQGMHQGMGGHHLARMLDVVKASPDQRSQIKTIMDAAHAELKAQREAGRGLQQQMQAALAAPNIDARQVETLRSQISAGRDAASKRMTQAMVDAARVLTPEQRKTLAEQMAQRRSMLERHASERAAFDGGGR